MVTVDSMAVYFAIPEALKLEYSPPIVGFPACSACGGTSGPGTCLDIEARKLLGLSIPSRPKDSTFSNGRGGNRGGNGRGGRPEGSGSSDRSQQK